MSDPRYPPGTMAPPPYYPPQQRPVYPAPPQQQPQPPQQQQPRPPAAQQPQPPERMRPAPWDPPPPGAPGPAWETNAPGEQLQPTYNPGIVPWKLAKVMSPEQYDALVASMPAPPIPPSPAEQLEAIGWTAEGPKPVGA
jgi:hypothetical protein